MTKEKNDKISKSEDSIRYGIPIIKGSKGRTSSVFLGDQAPVFAHLRTFYPEFTLASVLRTTIDKISSDNSILQHPDSHDKIVNHIKMVNDYLHETFENHPNIQGNEVISPRPSHFYDDPKTHRILALSFCEFLLQYSPMFRQCFINTCNEHDYDWFNILSVDPNDYVHDNIHEDVTLQMLDVDWDSETSYSFKYDGTDISHKSISSTIFDRDFVLDNMEDSEDFLLCINPITMGDEIISELNYEDVITQPECDTSHDHELILKVLLLETFSNYLTSSKLPRSSDSPTKTEQTTLMVKQFLTAWNDEDTPTNSKPRLIIDYTGIVDRKGRIFYSPIRICDEKEANRFLQKSLTKKEGESTLKYISGDQDEV